MGTALRKFTKQPLRARGAPRGREQNPKRGSDGKACPKAPAGTFPQRLGKSRHDASVKGPIASPSPQCRPRSVRPPVTALSYSRVLFLWAVTRTPGGEVSGVIRAGSVRTPIMMMPCVQTDDDARVKGGRGEKECRVAPRYGIGESYDQACAPRARRQASRENFHIPA